MLTLAETRLELVGYIAHRGTAAVGHYVWIRRQGAVMYEHSDAEHAKVCNRVRGGHVESADAYILMYSATTPQKRAREEPGVGEREHGEPPMEVEMIVPATATETSGEHASRAPQPTSDKRNLQPEPTRPLRGRTMIRDAVPKREKKKSPGRKEKETESKRETGRRKAAKLKKTRMVSWNVRTAATPGRKQMIVKQLRKIGAHIACLQETRGKGISAPWTWKGWTIVTSGGDQDGNHGVGFAFGPDVEVLSTQFDSCRSGLAHIRHGIHTFWVANVYAKCGDTSDVIAEDAMSETLDLMDRHNVHEAILMGDFNAKVNAVDWEEGGHPCYLASAQREKMPKDSDRNGRKLMLMCSERQLAVCNLATTKPWRACTTYTHVDGKESLLDYVAIPRSWRTTCRNAVQVGTTHDPQWTGLG